MKAATAATDATAGAFAENDKSAAGSGVDVWIVSQCSVSGVSGVSGVSNREMGERVPRGHVATDAEREGRSPTA
ncbi:MAG: hypothetical protein WBP56_15040 [Polyangia bacterium]